MEIHIDSDDFSKACEVRKFLKMEERVSITPSGGIVIITGSRKECQEMLEAATLRRLDIAVVKVVEDIQ